MEEAIEKIIPHWEIDDAMNSVFGNPGDYVPFKEYNQMRQQLYKQHQTI